MRILYVHRTQAQGVEGVHINSIIESFKALGHEVDVISPDSKVNDSLKMNPKESSIKKIFSWMSKHLPEWIFELAEISYNFVLYRKIIAQCTNHQYQLIYERYAIFSIAASYYSNKKNIPHIIEVNYTSKSALVRQRNRFLAPLASYFDRYIFSRASGLAPVSSYLKQQLINDYSIDEKRILVVPNAADPTKFICQAKAKDLLEKLNLGDGPVVGFVGGFYPWHGLSLLIEAFSRLVGQFPNARLLLIGDGPERGNIQQKVIELGIQQQVIFLGAIAHENLPNYINLFDVGVMPDSNEYGSPMKIFEYMAMGKPVIGPDYVPILDVIENGRQGWVFKRLHVDALAHCLELALSEPEQLKAMSLNARAMIEQERNWMQNARMNMSLVGH